jgi:hypothetical protein
MQNSTQKPMCKNKNSLSIELVNRPFINYWVYANSLVTCQCTLCCMLCVAFKLFSMGSMAWNMREEDIFQHISNTSMDTLEASIWYQFRRSGLKVYNGNAVNDHGSYRVEMFSTRGKLSWVQNASNMLTFEQPNPIWRSVSCLTIYQSPGLLGPMPVSKRQNPGLRTVWPTMMETALHHRKAKGLYPEGSLMYRNTPPTLSGCWKMLPKSNPMCAFRIAGAVQRTTP